MALGITRGQSMFNSNRKFTLLALVVLALSTTSVFAQEGELSSVSASSLPINVANAEQATQAEAVSEKDTETLISPSKAQVVAEENPSADASVESAPDGSATKTEEKPSDASVSPQTNEPADLPQSQNQADTPSASSDVHADTSVTVNTQSAPVDTQSAQDSSFDFDLKMKNVNASSTTEPVSADTPQQPNAEDSSEPEIPTNVQYTVDPLENLGNSVLSKLDEDLFSQMSQIEKSTTLLTLELRREKIRNEIEAQKAIRRKNAEDIERQKAEEKLRELERKKQIEAQVIREQQILADKEKLIEILKQRKLINAYMNQMLIMQQDWLKEKEGLYIQLAAAEEDKKAVIASFRQKLDRVLEASAKNIQVAEEAKANFERIVKGLKVRNEQLKKRIEADALIIKSAKSSLYLKSKSIEELKDRNAALLAAGKDALTNTQLDEALSSATEEEDDIPVLLSSEYAILGITGQADKMRVELIDSHGQSSSYMVGSVLPTGHIVSEIGSDFARFTRDDRDDFLYIGRSIDGVVPTLGLLKDAGSN